MLNPISCLWRRLSHRSSNAAPSSRIDPTAVLERLETFSAIATVVIFVGIGLEAWATIHFQRPDESNLELGAKLAADALIGLALIVEVGCILRAIFATRAERRESDEKVAEANKAAEEAKARAQEAALELIKFRTPRRLLIEQSSRISEALKALGEIPFAIAAARADEDILYLSGSIAECLVNAGWKPERWPANVEGSIERAIPLITTVWIRVGGFPVNNILVLFSAGNERAAIVAAALASLLRTEGLTAFHVATVPGSELVLVIVGPKT